MKRHLLVNAQSQYQQGLTKEQIRILSGAAAGLYENTLVQNRQDGANLGFANYMFLGLDLALRPTELDTLVSDISSENARYIVSSTHIDYFSLREKAARNLPVQLFRLPLLTYILVKHRSSWFGKTESTKNLRRQKKLTAQGRDMIPEKAWRVTALQELLFCSTIEPLQSYFKKPTKSEIRIVSGHTTNSSINLCYKSAASNERNDIPIDVYYDIQDGLILKDKNNVEFNVLMGSCAYNAFLLKTWYKLVCDYIQSSCQEPALRKARLSELNSIVLAEFKSWAKVKELKYETSLPSFGLLGRVKSLFGWS